jgi:hypothetical protein
MMIESRSDEIHSLKSDWEKLSHKPNHSKKSIENEGEDYND